MDCTELLWYRLVARAEKERNMRITDITPQKTVADKKERWVAYGRVSSKSIEQLHSFTAQIRHYKDYL